MKPSGRRKGSASAAPRLEDVRRFNPSVRPAVESGRASPRSGGGVSIVAVGRKSRRPFSPHPLFPHTNKIVVPQGHEVVKTVRTTARAIAAVASTAWLIQQGGVLVRLRANKRSRLVPCPRRGLAEVGAGFYGRHDLGQVLAAPLPPGQRSTCGYCLALRVAFRFRIGPSRG